MTLEVVPLLRMLAAHAADVAPQVLQPLITLGTMEKGRRLRRIVRFASPVRAFQRCPPRTQFRIRRSCDRALFLGLLPRALHRGSDTLE